MSVIAKASGLTFMIWILVGCVLCFGAMLDSSFGTSTATQQYSCPG
jgi:carbon starvation protein CstA